MKSRRNIAADSEYPSGKFLRKSVSPFDDSSDYVVEEFFSSMPERYRQEFDRTTTRQHARVATARNRLPIYADLFPGNSANGPGICVVADDAPGLLAVISTGLMLEGFDIIRADAYTRRTLRGDYEAVDLFWVRRSPPKSDTPLTEEDSLAIRNTLLELVGSGTARKHLELALKGISPGESETRVRFRDIRGVPWLTLELEANDRPGLLAAVTAALASEGIQIIDSRVRTYGLRVHDYFDILGADGSRPTGANLQRIQLAVFSAIDGPFRSASVSG
jgi:[protein-PII] uridylyltransferase